MTNTAPAANRPISYTDSLGSQPVFTPGAGSLVAQIVRAIQVRIDEKLLRNGSRMPSIRQFAETHGVSRFTVVEAYDRLVAQGYLESRRGSGFYVRERAPLAMLPPHSPRPAHSQLDVVWLVRNIFRDYPLELVPGTGLLPAEWLDADLVGNGLRAISKQNARMLLQYGTPQGFLPLRQQLQLKLAELEIAASPDQILTTSGITQGLDLITRHFAKPGDTIFVDDPAWFLMFGSFATLGINVVGIPRLSDGPDIAQLAQMAALHRPKLFVINSVLHNPTSTSLSAAKAFQVLKIAEQFDFTIVEDDVYCDLHPGSNVQPATRIASLDQLNRVIYLGSFSKTLAANLRVGFIAASADVARTLADRKILTTLTTSEIGERLVYKILSEGHYRKHVDRLRSKLDGVREKTIRQLEQTGARIDIVSPAGMFVWIDVGRDSYALAEKATDAGIVLAPGVLFSPNQLPSTRLRMNLAVSRDTRIFNFLKQEIARGA